MSYLTYLASDYPLEEVKNPHDRLLSVNEALALGVKDIPEELLAPGFDRDKPEVILCADRRVDMDLLGRVTDGDYDDDFCLTPFEEGEDVYTQKAYKVALGWHRFTRGRAEKIIEYIKENLRHTDQVEIWRIWMGTDETPTICSLTVPVSKLTAQDIYEIDNRDVVDAAKFFGGLPVQYRLVITAE
ncbi:MAG: hypothetical protein IKY34_07045 [Ruminiclostridium sp.]|nr:hypothetical protein [Ruminiclostridium sp.]